MTYRRDERHPLVTAFLEPLRSAGLEVIPDIGPGDEMYRYLLALRHGSRDRALVDYFRSGYQAAAVLAPLVRALTAQTAAPVRVLDFAAGWGRVTRFLGPLLPEAEIRVSDVSAGSTEFQRDVLGIEGFRSALRPEDLAPAESEPFDVVLVSSLFTHLPRRTFPSWLARLWDLVAPGGALVFTTHDVSTLPPDEEPDDDGFRYLERSEIDTLDKGDYGETWVSEDFVARRLSELESAPGDWRRLSRGLWSFQDLYVARKGAELPELPHDPGPDGRVEGASWEEAAATGDPDRLWLAGWAAEPDGAAARLEVTLNGEPAGVFERVPWGEEDAGQVGFRGWIAAPEDRGLWPTDVLHLRAVSAGGRHRVIHLSTVGDLPAELRERDLHRRLADAERELHNADRFIRGHTRVVEGLEARIEAMEMSFFWKLRNLWWAVRPKKRPEKAGPE